MKNPQYFPELEALSGVPYHTHDTETPAAPITGTNRQVAIFDTDSEVPGPMKAGRFRPDHWSEIINGAPTESGTWVAGFTNNPVDPDQDMFFIKTGFIPEDGTIPIYDDSGALFVYTGTDANHAVNRKDLIDAISTVSQGSDGIGTEVVALQTVIGTKVDKAANMGLSERSFTQSEKTKLASIVEHYAGRFVSLTDLNAVVGAPGGYAYVSIDSAPTVLYAWNAQTSTWDSTVLAVSEESPESIKLKYEANADTNVFSNAQKTNLTSAVTHIASKSNPHDTTKAQVGLSNVDNTSDVNKPVSTAQAAALALKQNALVSGTNIKTVNGVSILGSGNINTNAIISTTTTNSIKTTEYFNRFEYTCKIPINQTVPNGAANYTTLTTAYILPTGITIDSSDEHYISIRNDNRGMLINVWDNSDRKIVLGFHNTWTNGPNTSKGTVFIKLVKFK